MPHKAFVEVRWLAWGLLFLVGIVASAMAGALKDSEGRFQNRYEDLSSSQGFLSWQWHRLTEGLPKPAKTATPVVLPDLKAIQNPAEETQVTWIGHSSLLYQIDGRNILLDPVYAAYASPVPPLGPKRAQPPGIPFDALPHIDAVLISHNHYDHLDLETVRQLMRQAGGPPKFYVPLGVEQWFLAHVSGSQLEGPAQNVIAMNWDEQQTLLGREFPITIHFLAVQHWSARSPFDRNETLWGSWGIQHPAFRFWFSGDLGYSKDIEDIAQRYAGFDLAAIAIGVYEPRWFMRRAHVDPDESVRIFKTLQARQAIGIHWGTFDGLSDESLDQPPKDLAKAKDKAGITDDQFMLLAIGETRRFRRLDR
jgi:L-ascorbate metabolism protein UlaG (beta-lactamase superfamily)